MRTARLLTLGILVLAGGNIGCVGRMISEGLGAATGAAGKVLDIDKPAGLAKYHGFQVESLTITQGLKAPSNLTQLVRAAFMEASRAKGLTPEGKPGLLVSGEIISFESAGAVDEAIGPLEEIIIRAKLMDAGSKEVLAVANLIGRAKSTSAGGEKKLSQGAAKALKKWLKAGGIAKDEDEEKEKKKK